MVVVFVVVTGGGAGLMAGTKPWRRTSWSSSASGRCRRLGGKARWRPDKAVRRAAHPVMQALRPPVAAGQLRRPSSSPRLASVEDTDDDDDDIDNDGGGLWQRGRCTTSRQSSTVFLAGKKHQVLFSEETSHV